MTKAVCEGCRRFDGDSAIGERPDDFWSCNVLGKLKGANTACAT